MSGVIIFPTPGYLELNKTAARRYFILPTPAVGSRGISSRYSTSRKITFTKPSVLLTVAVAFFERSLERRSSTSARMISESRLPAKRSLKMCFSSCWR